MQYGDTLPVPSYPFPICPFCTARFLTVAKMYGVAVFTTYPLPPPPSQENEWRKCCCSCEENSVQLEWR